jgi:hypothetical protein
MFIAPPTIDQIYLAIAIGSCRQRLDPNATFDVPEYVATCPICGAKLWANFEEWEATGRSNRWRCTMAKLNCETEPDIDDPDFDDWMNGHYQMPYVDWMPLEIEIARWINRRYWFGLN